LCSFFYYAKVGIRAFHVTGVQTCALPICNDAHLVSFSGANGEESIPVCSPCVDLIEATPFLQDVEPADRVEFLATLRNDKGIGKDRSWSLRPPGYKPKPDIYAPKPKPRSKLRERLAQRNQSVV